MADQLHHCEKTGEDHRESLHSSDHNLNRERDVDCSEYNLARELGLIAAQGAVKAYFPEVTLSSGVPEQNKPVGTGKQEQIVVPEQIRTQAK